jgi:ubiquitin-conjugating enzyme E2 C
MPLPPDILLFRLRNELRSITNYVSSMPELIDRASFPLDIEIKLTRVPGPVVESGKVTLRYDHCFKMVINENYPYEKPTVMWLTPIFHPNIMMPEDGGHLCTKLLDEWSFNSTIISFIKGVESLVMNPNPSSPFGSDSCTAAAEYFNTGEKRLPPLLSAPPPRVKAR